MGPGQTAVVAKKPQDSAAPKESKVTKLCEDLIDQIVELANKREKLGKHKDPVIFTINRAEQKLREQKSNDLVAVRIDSNPDLYTTEQKQALEAEIKLVETKVKTIILEIYQKESKLLARRDGDEHGHRLRFPGNFTVKPMPKDTLNGEESRRGQKGKQQGATPLLIAVAHGLVDVVQWLISDNLPEGVEPTPGIKAHIVPADVDKVCTYQIDQKDQMPLVVVTTALKTAIEIGNLDMIRLLSQKGQKPYLPGIENPATYWEYQNGSVSKPPFKGSPLREIFFENGRISQMRSEVEVRKVLAAIATTTAFTGNLLGFAILDAVTFQMPGVVRDLMQRGEYNVEISQQTVELALKQPNCVELIRALFANNVFSESHNKRLLTLALQKLFQDFATNREMLNAKLIEALVKLGADVNTPHLPGDLPIFGAVDQINAGVFLLLKEKGANLVANPSLFERLMRSAMTATWATVRDSFMVIAEGLIEVTDFNQNNFVVTLLNRIADREFDAAHELFLKILAKNIVLSKESWLSVLGFYVEANPDQFKQVLAYVKDLEILNSFQQAKPKLSDWHGEKLRDRMKILTISHEFEKQRVRHLIANASRILASQGESKKENTIPSLEIDRISPNAEDHCPLVPGYKAFCGKPTPYFLEDLRALAFKKVAKATGFFADNAEWDDYVKRSLELVNKFTAYVHEIVAVDEQSMLFDRCQQEQLLDLLLFALKIELNEELLKSALEQKVPHNRENLHKALNKFIVYIQQKNYLAENPALIPKILLLLVRADQLLDNGNALYSLLDQIKPEGIWEHLLLPTDGEGRATVFHLARCKCYRAEGILKKFLPHLLKAPRTFLNALDLKQPGIHPVIFQQIESWRLGQRETLLDLYFANQKQSGLPVPPQDVPMQEIALRKVFAFFVENPEQAFTKVIVKDVGERTHEKAKWTVNALNVLEVFADLAKTNPDFAARLNRLMQLQPPVQLAEVKATATTVPAQATDNSVQGLEAKSVPAREARTASTRQQQLLVQIESQYAVFAEFLQQRNKYDDFVKQLLVMTEIENQFIYDPAVTAAAVDAMIQQTARSGVSQTTPAAGNGLRGPSQTTVRMQPLPPPKFGGR